MTNNFGPFARQKRKSAGLSQSTVAAALGLHHRSGISRKEAGGLEWSLNDVIALAGVLGMTASDLLAEFERQG